MKATRNNIGVPIADRLFEKLVPADNGCIEFVGSRSHFGHGQITPNGTRTKRKAHRVVWEMIHGPIPEGMMICHTCDNPPCCNPDHLFMGTRLDNMADMRAKNRSRNGKKTHCVNGHEFTAENTLPRVGVAGRVGRRCRTCRDASNRKKTLRRQAAKLAA